MIFTSTIDTPLGTMTAAAEEDSLVGLWFNGQKHFPAATLNWPEAPDLPVFAALRRELESYFSGHGSSGNPLPGRPLPLPLAPKGTAFQKAVWDALRRIPFGQTVTYGDIAREIAAAMGRPSMSAQAVGSAVGHNPISILIPCHRVVGCNGKLTGYAGGLDRKEALLRLEGIQLPPL